jgi:ATP phosphoribosyltransferase
LESTTKLIANKSAWNDSWKRAKIEQLAILIQGALAAETRVLLKMNAHRGRVEAVLKILPALHAPTINPLSDQEWVAIESVVAENIVREIIPKLKAVGAEGIVEIPLNKVVA